MRNKLEGVIVPTVTALTDDSRFDNASQKRLIRYLAANGVNGIFSLGLTGEFQYLTADIKREVMDTVASTVEDINASGGNVEVVLGVNGPTLGETLDSIEYASKLPINGIVLQPSSVPGTDYTSLIEQAIKITRVHIYLYTNPKTAIGKKESITPKNIREISEATNICGVKVSNGFDELGQFCGALDGTDTSVYIGNALDLFQAFSKSAKISNQPRGVITGPGNLFPEEWVKAWELREQFDSDERQGLLDRFSSFRDLYYGMPGGKNTVAAIKYILHREGILSSPRCLSAIVSREAQEYLSAGFYKIK